MGVKVDSESMVQASGRMEVPFTEMGKECGEGRRGRDGTCPAGCPLDLQREVLRGPGCTSLALRRKVGAKIQIWNSSAYGWIECDKTG